MSSIQSKPLLQNVLDQLDLNANAALDRYCDKNPLFSLIERIKAFNRRKLTGQRKNDVMTVDPHEMHEIIDDINKLGIY